jgi:hypothetical protein
MMTQTRPSTQTKSPVSKKATLLIAMILILCTGQAWAQSSLGDLVKEGGNEWMMGTWSAWVEGETVTVTYKWELNKNMISVHIKTPEFEYKGIIVYRASDSEIVQVAADSTGRTSTGVWQGEYGTATLRQTTLGEYGDKEVTEFTHYQKDSNTMKIDIKNISNSGWTDAYPTMTLELNRQKK